MSFHHRLMDKISDYMPVHTIYDPSQLDEAHGNAAKTVEYATKTYNCIDEARRELNKAHNKVAFLLSYSVCITVLFAVYGLCKAVLSL